MTKKTYTFLIDGHKVYATFAKAKNKVLYTQIKHMLLSSYIDALSKQ